MLLYPWILALHLITMVAWMAGMLYLPRLYVYHTGTKPGSEASEIFKVMERRLLRFIINPAMIATLVFGMALLWLNPSLLQARYMQAKLALVVLMFTLHGYYARHRRFFEKDQRFRSARFWRVMNEAPTLLLIGIIVLVIVKPG